MKPIGNNVLVAVNMHQKDDYEIELIPGVKIWMNSNFGVNNRETQPVLALVHAVPDGETEFKVGEFVLAWHNSFNRWQGGRKYLHGDTGENDGHGLRIFRLEKNMIYMRVDAQGDAHPLRGYLTVELVEDKPDTFLEIPDSAKRYFNNKFRVLEVGPGCDGLEPGMVVVTPKNSNYEMLYSFNYKRRSVMRVKYDEVLSVDYGYNG